MYVNMSRSVTIDAGLSIVRRQPAIKINRLSDINWLKAARRRFNCVDVIAGLSFVERRSAGVNKVRILPAGTAGPSNC
jgi:hypothetical protein